MKKIALLCMLLIIAIACVKAPTEQTAEKEQPIEQTETQPASTPAAEQAKTETAPTKEVGVTPPTRPLPSERVDTSAEPASVPKTEMSPQLRDLLKRSTEKLQSVQYLYGGSSTKNLFLDTYYVKGDKMKIKKYEEQYYVRDGYYDTIYVDLAVGCCEELSRCKSHNVDNTNTKFDVDTAMLNVPKTPLQWVKEIPSSAKIIGPQTFNERSVTYIKYTQEGNEVGMWMDDTYGVPHKVVIADAQGNEIKHQYNDMKFNSLKDTAFDAPCD